MYACIDTSLCAYACVYVCIRVHLCVHVCICMYMYVYLCIPEDVALEFITEGLSRDLSTDSLLVEGKELLLVIDLEGLDLRGFG